MLRGVKTINENTKWEKIKLRLDRDERYKAVGSSRDREELFNQYIHEISKAKVDIVLS